MQYNLDAMQQETENERELKGLCDGELEILEAK